MGEGLNKINFKNNPTIIELHTSQVSSYVPRHPRPTYLNTNALRSSTTRRKGLFGGSIHYVWRLNSLRLEVPNATVTVVAPLFDALPQEELQALHW